MPSSKTAAEDALTKLRSEVRATSAAGSRVGSAVGSSSGARNKPSIDDIVRDYQFCSEYVSNYKPIDPRSSKNMQAAGRDVLKMAIYGEMASKREEKPASMVSACTLISKGDGVMSPPPKPLKKNRSAPSLLKGDGPVIGPSPEDQEGSVAGWRGLTISGYRGPRAPVIPKSEMMRPGNALYRCFQSEYNQSFHGRMPQGPGLGGKANSSTNPLTREDLESWQQALEEERRRLEKDRALIEQQQDLLVDQRAKMKGALGFSGAN